MKTFKSCEDLRRFMDIASSRRQLISMGGKTATLVGLGLSLAGGALDLSGVFPGFIESSPYEVFGPYYEENARER